MKRWKVIAQSVTQYEVEVMAENEDEAMDKADQIDGAEWVEDSPCGDWDVLRAEEVTE